MTLNEIKKIVQLEESETLEFKLSTAQLGRACETLCGFLNHRGGVVLFGISDRGGLVGQMVSDKTRQDIAQELKKFEPSVRPTVDYVPLEDQKQIIIFKVSVGEHRPYTFDGRAYERVESTTRRMSQVRYDHLVAQRAQLNYSWEKFEAEKYTLAYLDTDLILGVVRKAVEVKRLPETALRQEVPSILERLGLLEEGHIKNAAVALFGKKFSNYPQCQLKLARFKGITRSEFLDSNIIYGNVFQFLEEAMLFVKRHLPVAAKVVSGQLERVETPLIPFKAIREAIINALCHRDYSEYGGSIGLAIYDDRMEIFNHGGLLQGVTLQKIKSQTGFSKLRNPIIAEVLYKADLIEKWGRGIQEIITQCLEAGDPDPEFLADEYEFKIIFRFPSDLKPSTLLIEGSPSAKANLTQRQLEIVALLEGAKALKATEIMEKLSEPPARRTLMDDLAALKKLGLVDNRGSTRSAVWFLIGR